MTVPTRPRLRLQIAAGVALILSIVVAPPIAAAATPAQDPTALITYVGTQGIQTLGALWSAERIARLGSLFQQDFDVNGIGLFALGRYRSAATPAEQQEFFRLYPEFTVRAFNARLDDYRGAPFRITGQRAIGNETVVSSEIQSTAGGRVQIDWYLADTSGQFRVTDVTIGGMSMKVALRNQFASWIENNGGRFSALLAVLRQQIAQKW
jgi:phospholipid transport system substrate-binding protein